MDNIFKLTVGCLGVVGLIVMIVPNSDPLAGPNTGSPQLPPIVGAQPIASSSQSPPSNGFPTEPEKPSEFVVDDYDIGSFGEPMVDPTPPAQKNLIAQQRQMQEQQQIENGNQLSVGQGNFNQPQVGVTIPTPPAAQMQLPPAVGN